MAKVLNDTDALTFILTQYGLNRVAEAIADPTEELNLSKIKVGDANFEYYTPVETQTTLKNPIPDGEFYIVEKQLLEDNLTVSLHAVFPESFQNAEIREVGIYETIDGVDYLFAISTQQPLLKPYMDLDYLISVDYYAFLKSQNLADVYEQIVLDPDNQLVTEEDLENLMSTILFTENNLMEQINGNTRVIGLNRAQQLHEKIEENRRDFGYYAAYNNYSTILDYVDAEKVFGYWIFNYPRRTSPSASIIDIGLAGRNFSTNANVNSYNRVYNGIMPMLKFNSPNYYFLNEEMAFLTEDKTADISFTMGFAVEPLSTTGDRTLLARSNYATNSHVFEITEKADNSLEIKLFADSSNYITFSSDSDIIPSTPHSLVFTYDADTALITAFVAGHKVELTKTTTGTYICMNSTPSTLYAYTYTPTQVIYANNSATPTTLLNADGSPYAGGDWAISNNQVFYKSNTSNYSSADNVQTVRLYAWVYNDGTQDHIIYTKVNTIAADTPMFNSDYTPYTGTDFAIVQSGTSYIITYLNNNTTYTSSKDILPTTLYAFKYIGSLQTIWANSSTTPSVLYESNGDMYTGTEWTIVNSTVRYEGNAATYTPSGNVTVPSLPATSFVVNSQGANTNFVNSNVGAITVIKERLTDAELRALSLNLEATMGNNPCIVTY